MSTPVAPSSSAESATARYPVAPRGRELFLLSAAALGIVYGDIGTSPLYALRVCFSGVHAVRLDPGNVLGVLSLIFWTLALVVGLKYHAWILRLDNRGEGGILALLGLVRPEGRAIPGVRSTVILLGVLGVALFYGDGIMTPAISVLAAVEGLELVSPAAKTFVLPISIALLAFLFVFQRRGTVRVGRGFGGVMALWFVTIGGLGLAAIAKRPAVLEAVDPRHAISFFSRNGLAGFLVLSSVFLVATGAEALYADMGRFGRRAMQLDWLAIVFPALLLNYFGQGALLLENPDALRNPFYLLAPSWAVVPLVGLATAAALIAAQAVISGAFSLTRQAVQLNYLPRVKIAHTSKVGQIYISGISWVGMLGTVAVILMFPTSTLLADAYGVSIAMAMAVTTLLAYGGSRKHLGWGAGKALLATAFFLFVDAVFVVANLAKVPRGGWVSLAAAALTFLLMTTWRRGRRILAKRLEADTLPLDTFLDGVARKPRLRVPGTAIFMDRGSSGTPPALLHNLRHNKALHERIVFLTVETSATPFVSRRQRVQLEPLKEGFLRINLRFGFMQDPDVPRALRDVEIQGHKFDMMDTTFFLGRETLIATGALGMPVWREKLFVLMSRNSTSAMEFFRLPPNRVIELGAQIEL